MEQLPAKHINKLNALRQEQRGIVDKLNLLDNDITETKLVVEALQKVDPERKCYRSQGGVLVEQKVKDVVPVLEKSREQLESMATKAKEEITEKGKAIQTFMTENNIALKKQ